MNRRALIGEMLVAQGRIDAHQLRSALAHQRQWGGRLGHSLVALGFLGEAEMLRAVGEQLGVPFVEIGDREVPPAVVRLLPEKLMRLRHAFPLEVGSGSHRGPVTVAVSDANDLSSLDEIAFAAGMAVRPVLAAQADIDRAIARHLGGPAPEARRPGPVAPPQLGKDDKMELVERPRTPRTTH